jgi:hypothetical protein
MTQLAFPLDSFEYEQAEIKQMFMKDWSWIKHTHRPNHIASDLLPQDLIEKNFPVLTKNIEKFLHKDDVFVARFFATRPHSCGDVHIDMRKERTLVRDWSLNLPIENCDNTYHEWFDTHNIPHTESKHSALFWRNFTAGTLIHRHELNGPAIMKVSIPHRINNPLDTFRLILGIRTESNSFNYPLV